MTVNPTSDTTSATTAATGGTAATAPVPAAGRTPARSVFSRKNRIGLVLTFLMGVVNLPSVLAPSDGSDGHDSPPAAINILDSVCGVLIMIACVVAWRRGLRGAARLAAGLNILVAISTVPAFFVDVPAGLKVAAAIAMVVTFLGVVLTLSPAERRAA